ncbi:hypothetical protein NLU13_8400 [Sarocladium strictum]|uniref:Glycosyltransferase family 2 protein n=1 Tax=Sarocladium strictum TaxID=5046 RepID=A0AA39GDY9_SARSR|nr:hypothetical protein NLU13_8400 [Sarocladium strictum]
MASKAAPCVENTFVSDLSSTEALTVDFDSASIFNAPERKPLTINPFLATFNIVSSFGLVGALIAGYVIGLRLLDLDITSIGLYGAILMTEYLVQLACAVINRFEVDRIVRKRIKKTAVAQDDCEKGVPHDSSRTALLNPEGDVSIAVVGYREDEQAWRDCLRSLQTQTLRPKCVVGVVDGNEEPDISMAEAFVSEFESYRAPLIHLPILLSELHRKTYFDKMPPDTRWWTTRTGHWLSGRFRAGHDEALACARRAVMEQIQEWDEKWAISTLDAVCFSQPHGHKRTAMFTAFAMSLYALRTRDAIFTTDSDTLVQSNGLDEMLTLLLASDETGGVTADVKIWNRRESLLARMCAARYWFAFNIERACQSLWRCVGCLSGPMSMYRASDLDTILGLWNLQTFSGKETTFGDDRHLTNQILAQGLKTRYTHRTWCDSESPTSFVRWVAQQTRWSKSFFREAFWFPASFLHQSPWMLIEMTIQTLYPFILIATVFNFLFNPASNPWRPLLWICTMFGVALFKALLAVLIAWDLWLLLFSFYGFIYFFGLLPSKVYAIFTINQTGWGTSARSSSERKRGQSFLQRSFHICHLVLWYTAIFVGVGFFVYRILGNPLYFLIGAFALLPSALLYWDKSSFLSSLKARLCCCVARRKNTGPKDEAVYQYGPKTTELLLPTKPAPVYHSTSDLSVISSKSSPGTYGKNTPDSHTPVIGFSPTGAGREIGIVSEKTTPMKCLPSRLYQRLYLRIVMSRVVRILDRAKAEQTQWQFSLQTSSLKPSAQLISCATTRAINTPELKGITKADADNFILAVSPGTVLLYQSHELMSVCIGVLAPAAMLTLLSNSLSRSTGVDVDDDATGKVNKPGRGGRFIAPYPPTSRWSILSRGRRPEAMGRCQAIVKAWPLAPMNSNPRELAAADDGVVSTMSGQGDHVIIGTSSGVVKIIEIRSGEMLHC